jgi:hypothetical protein
MRTHGQPVSEYPEEHHTALMVCSPIRPKKSTRTRKDLLGDCEGRGFLIWYRPGKDRAVVIPFFKKQP